jgi:hypothetical protein
MRTLIAKILRAQLTKHGECFVHIEGYMLKGMVLSGIFF